MSVFGVTLAMALSMMPAERDLSCVELWAGVGSIARAAGSEGMDVIAMDINRIPGETNVSGPKTENILLKQGFMSALRTVLRLRPSGLLWMAPVCSSFVFMNSSNCKRTKENPAGNTAYGPVKDGNRVALIAAFFYALAMLIGCKPVMEQPSGSMMFRLPIVAKVVAEFKAKSATCVRCAFTPGMKYGTRFLKRYKFVGQDWVKHLHTKCTCPDKKHVSMVSVGRKGDINGNLKALKESQSYPPKLGEFVVNKWMEETADPVHCGSVRFPVPSSSWKRPAAGDTDVPTKKAKTGAQSSSSSWKRPTA